MVYVKTGEAYTFYKNFTISSIVIFREYVRINHNINYGIR